MSRLEAQTKPILLPMIDGEPRDLTASEQLVLSRWIDKTVMVHEFSDLDSCIASQDDRERVIDETDPSPARHTRVWIGRNGGDVANPSLRHRASPLFAAQPPHQFIEGIRSDVLAVGNVVFYAISCTTARFADYQPRAIANLHAKLVQIWPVAADPAHWPPLEALSDPEIIRLAEALSMESMNGQLPGTAVVAPNLLNPPPRRPSAI